MRYDLAVCNGTIIDPSQKLECSGTLVVGEGRIAEILPEGSDVDARATVDASDCLVVPGLIDMHTHVYWGGSLTSIEAEQRGRRSYLAWPTKSVRCGRARAPTWRC